MCINGLPVFFIYYTNFFDFFVKNLQKWKLGFDRYMKTMVRLHNSTCTYGKKRNLNVCLDNTLIR
ncbi:hypothetical protein M23134_01520 [Microscilla marina ATCC 23134]|uniref:Uncharacterized protein n=1 Tax=Microscilla marina ATCC 23134 TaxID=313606 RepID=A1ZK07_MICM2|nr:hypothetical protein M23134_01520 [Microscilla marina ATCC 23134]